MLQPEDTDVSLKLGDYTLNIRSGAGVSLCAVLGAAAAVVVVRRWCARGVAWW